MRKYTLLLSVCVHGLAVGALIVVPLLAPEVLPSLRERALWIAVQAAAVPPPPPPPPPAGAPDPATAPSTVTTAAVPVVAPEGIRAELPQPPAAETLIAAERSGRGTVSWGVERGAGDLVVSPPPPRREPPAPMRVGGVVRPPLKIRHVPPVYPPLAQASRVEGVVILEAVIAEDGTVRDVRVTRSKPLLDAAAVEAVRQWRFTPPTLNGMPVPVVMSVTVAFELK